MRFTSFNVPWGNTPPPPDDSFTVAQRHRTVSPSGSSRGIRIIPGQFDISRTKGIVTDTGDELIWPVSVLVVKLRVVDKDQLPPPTDRPIQQQLL